MVKKPPRDLKARASRSPIVCGRVAESSRLPGADLRSGPGGDAGPYPSRRPRRNERTESFTEGGMVVPKATRET